MVTNLTSSRIASAQLSQFVGDRDTSLRSDAAGTLKTGQGTVPKAADQPRTQFITSLLRALSAVAV